MKNTYAGLSLRALATLIGNKRKIEPKDLPCCTIHLLLIADTQQIEILATALLTQACKCY